LREEIIMGRKKKEYVDCIMFTLPAIALVMITIYIPFVMSGYYSLMEWNGISKKPVFIGLDNFAQLFRGSSDFIKSLIFTGKYTVLFMLFTNVLAIAIAVALVQKIRAANVMRSMFFIPYIMSMTIVGFIWKFIFSQGFAVLYEKTQLVFLNWSWLGSSGLAFWSVAFVGIWQSLGFYIVLYIAGLQAVPTDVLEAATVDGATSWKRFFKVTLPLLGPSVTTCIFMSLTNAVKVFDIILALTKGGPGGSTYSVTLDIYREAFQNNNYGLGSAKSLVFFVVILVVTQLVLKFMKSREVDL
jgi:raffinose/stachyose/melibiose transport system permease protein